MTSTLFTKRLQATLRRAFAFGVVETAGTFRRSGMTGPALWCIGSTPASMAVREHGARLVGARRVLTHGGGRVAPVISGWGPPIRHSLTVPFCVQMLRHCHVQSPIRRPL